MNTSIELSRVLLKKLYTYAQNIALQPYISSNVKRTPDKKKKTNIHIFYIKLNLSINLQSSVGLVNR